MPRAASPQGKAVGKPAAKPPPKTITPLGKAAVAKPPPKAVTAKAPPSKADKAWEDWEAAKAKVAERQQQENLAAPKSPPLFAVDWSRFTSCEAFLSKTAEVCRLDPNSAEGYNHHVSSYYYVSTDRLGCISPPVLQLTCSKTTAGNLTAGFASTAGHLTPRSLITKQWKKG